MRNANRPFRRRRFLHALIIGYGLIWVLCAIRPLYPSDWLLENLLVFATVPALVYAYRRQPLSDLSYGLIAVFMALHAVGAHYTYSEVPLGRGLSDLMGLERNHFDRIVHFAFGLLITYPVRELLYNVGRMGPALSGLTSFALIAAASGIYEIIEMVAALIVSPETALAFLGVQGDVFDAQKDSALAMVGSLIAVAASRRHFQTPTGEVRP